MNPVDLKETLSSIEYELVVPWKFKLYDSWNFQEHTPMWSCNNGYIKCSTSFPALAHEISHVVEMNNINRLTKNDFGFKWYPKGNGTVPSHSGPGMIAMIARETRVRAIQSNLQVPTKPINEWLGGTIERLTTYRLPVGRFTKYNQVKEWALDMYARTSKAWDLDRIKIEWTKRMEYIHCWMEQDTKECLDIAC